MPSNLSPSHMDGEKHTWHRQTSLTSNLSPSHTVKQRWGANREDPRPLRFWRQFLGRRQGTKRTSPYFRVYMVSRKPKNLTLVRRLVTFCSPKNACRIEREWKAKVPHKDPDKTRISSFGPPPFSSRVNQKWYIFKQISVKFLRSNFVKFRPAVLELLHADGKTDIAKQILRCFMPCIMTQLL